MFRRIGWGGEVGYAMFDQEGFKGNKFTTIFRVEGYNFVFKIGFNK